MTQTAAERKLENIVHYVDTNLVAYGLWQEEVKGVGWFDSFALERVVYQQAVATLSTAIQARLKWIRDDDDNLTDEEKVEQIKNLVLERLINQTAFQSTSMAQNMQDMMNIRIAQRFLDNLTWW